MSKENIGLFYDALIKDKTLQEKLRLAGKKYEGQKPDETRTDSIYQNEVIPLAKVSGFDFTLAELKEYAKEIPKPKTGELTEKELSAVTGGCMCVCVLCGLGATGTTAYFACVFVGSGNSGCSCNMGGSGQIQPYIKDHIW